MLSIGVVGHAGSGDEGIDADEALAGVPGLPYSSPLKGVGGTPVDFADFGDVAKAKQRPPEDLGVIKTVSKSCSDFFFFTLDRLVAGRSFSDFTLRTSSGNRSENERLFFVASGLANGCKVTRLGLRFGREPVPVSRQGMEVERDFSKLAI